MKYIAFACFSPFACNQNIFYEWVAFTSKKKTMISSNNFEKCRPFENLWIFFITEKVKKTFCMEKHKMIMWKWSNRWLTKSMNIIFLLLYEIDPKYGTKLNPENILLTENILLWSFFFFSNKKTLFNPIHHGSFCNFIGKLSEHKKGYPNFIEHFFHFFNGKG
jgi:hypothetical protein